MEIEYKERQPVGKIIHNQLTELSELLRNLIDVQQASRHPEVMTAEDVQSFLQVSNVKFYNMKKEGLIKTISINGTKRYLKSQIMEMLLDHLIE